MEIGASVASADVQTLISPPPLPSCLLCLTLQEKYGKINWLNRMAIQRPQQWPFSNEGKLNDNTRLFFFLQEQTFLRWDFSTGFGGTPLTVDGRYHYYWLLALICVFIILFKFFIPQSSLVFSACIVVTWAEPNICFSIWSAELKLKFKFYLIISLGVSNAVAVIKAAFNFGIYRNWNALLEFSFSKC